MQISSHIESVKVFQQGALVRRRLTLEASERPAALEVAGLPLALLDASVRVRVIEAPAGLDVTLGEARVTLYAALPEELEAPPDEAALRALARQIERGERRVELLQNEQRALAELPQPPRPEPEEGKAPPPSPMRARLALEARVEEAIAARVEAVAEEEAQLRQQRRELGELRARVARASNAQRVDRRRVTKEVRAAARWSGEAAEGSVTIEIEYRVPGARWFPSYQCWIEDHQEQAKLHMRALICQRSGEDWSGARLELSTAMPESYTELPRPGSIRIGKAQPPSAARGFRPAPKGGLELFSDFDRDRRATAPPTPPALPPAPLPVASLDMPTPKPSPKRRKADTNERLREAEESEVMAEEAWDDAPELMMASAPAPAPAPASGARMATLSAPPPPPRQTPSAQPQPHQQPRAPQFMELLLPPASDTAGRGRLVERGLRDRYLEGLERRGLTGSEEGVAAVEAAAAQAVAAASTPMPSGAVGYGSVVGSFAYAWVSEDRVEVPSDGAWHSVPVQVQALGCAMTYVVVPREDRSVFRLAALENAAGSPLLAGPVEVYVGGDYVLTTQLPVVAPYERFTLGLGVEQRIKCARNTRFQEARTSAAVVATAELRHGITVELVNNLPQPVQCEVRERIPQPAPNAEVVVEEAALSLAWEPWSQVEAGRIIEGGRRWRVKLDAGAAMTLSAEYTIKIYANNEIVGGNRREA